MTPLNLISNSTKKIGVLGNYTQILVTVCSPLKTKNKSFAQLSKEEFELRRKLVKALNENSDQFSDLNQEICVT